MKGKISTLALLLITTTVWGQQPFDDFYAQANTFFETYVFDERVDYAAIKAVPAQLDHLYNALGKMTPSLDDPLNYQAFYINAYNLAVIKSVVDAYPISSPMDVNGFFDRNKHLIAGERITLNTLENERLRAAFDEARFHFVLVCGAVSCPPIVNFAYTPAQLNVQMEMQATKALNDPSFIRVIPGEEKVQLSEIFRWYTRDFATEEQGLITYINQFRQREIPAEYKITYYPYDWTLNRRANTPSTQTAPPNEGLNLQTYTAGTLLRKGQMDFTLFNTIYTETANDWQGEVFEGYRATFATALLQWTIGVSNNARFNVGFDLSLRGTGRASQNTSYGAMDRAFRFENTDSTRFGIGVIGPRIKFSPFKGINNFSIQSSLLFSPNEAPEGRSPSAGQGGLYWIEWDRYVWWNQFFYDKTFANDQFQVFAEVDLLFRFKRRENQVNHIDLPANLFFSYFPTPQITFYAMTQYVPRFAGSPVYDENGMDITEDFVIGANYTASGLGFKYQFTSYFNIELLYTNFWAARNNGLGETFNLGLKYLVL